MSLAGRLEAGPEKARQPCRVRTLAAALPEGEAAAFLAMVTDPKWSDAKTFQALRDEAVDGLPDSDQFIGKHRRRGCDCP